MLEGTSNIQRGEVDLQAEETEARYSDAELVNLIEREVHASQNDWQSKVAQTREWSQKYCYGELPYAVDNNTSSHTVCQTVILRSQPRSQTPPGFVT